MKVRILCAAVMQNNKVFVGCNHCLIIKRMHEIGCERVRQDQQGFVTDEGYFVTREEAAKIALASGQIKKLKYSTTKLFSEELYDQA